MQPRVAQRIIGQNRDLRNAAGGIKKDIGLSINKKAHGNIAKEMTDTIQAGPCIVRVRRAASYNDTKVFHCYSL